MHDRGSSLRIRFGRVRPLSSVSSAVEVKQEEEKKRVENFENAVFTPVFVFDPVAESTWKFLRSSHGPPPSTPVDTESQGPGTMFVMVAERWHSPPAWYPEALARDVQ